MSLVLLQAPATSPLLEGRWRLLFTTRPGTASPIQRTFTAVDSFAGGANSQLEGITPGASCFGCALGVGPRLPPARGRFHNLHHPPHIMPPAAPAVYQDIELAGEEVPRVCQVVDFGSSVGFLRVEAEASTDAQPLPGFTPRVGKGLPFGILGVSSSQPPARPNLRVDFQFDR